MSQILEKNNIIYPHFYNLIMLMIPTYLPVTLF